MLKQSPPNCSLLSNGFDPDESILTHKGVKRGRYLITLFLGANDASADIGLLRKVGQGVPVDEYHSNMNRIIDILQDKVRSQQGASSVADASPNIILITPGRVDEGVWPTRTNKRVAKYAG